MQVLRAEKAGQLITPRASRSGGIGGSQKYRDPWQVMTTFFWVPFPSSQVEESHLDRSRDGIINEPYNTAHNIATREDPMSRIVALISNPFLVPLLSFFSPFISPLEVILILMSISNVFPLRVKPT